jgi:hypothetical protein
MDGSASRPRHCLYLEQAREVVRGTERTYRQAERLADGVLHTLHPVQDRRGVILTSRIPAAFGQITVGTTTPRRSSRLRTCNSMMDRREALLLVDRIKRRTRDPDVLTLCEYVHGTDVHGTIPAFRRPDVPWTQPAVMPSASCPVCAARRAAETARKKRWRHGRRD